MRYTVAAIKAKLETVSDNLFEANNFLGETNTASKKIEILPGEAGSPERVQAYADMVERGEELPSLVD